MFSGGLNGELIQYSDHGDFFVGRKFWHSDAVTKVFQYSSHNLDNRLFGPWWFGWPGLIVLPYSDGGWLMSPRTLGIQLA